MGQVVNTGTCFMQEVRGLIQIPFQFLAEQVHPDGQLSDLPGGLLQVAHQKAHLLQDREDIQDQKKSGQADQECKDKQGNPYWSTHFCFAKNTV